MATVMLGMGCGAGETRIDPGDLELRDLLGVAPEAALRWDADQRAAARQVLVEGFRERATALPLAPSEGTSIDDRVARAMAALDLSRAERGDGALGVVRLTIGPAEVTTIARVADRAAAVAGGAPAPVTELWLAEQWDEHAWSYLPGRGLDVLSAIAVDAGHESGPLVVAPSSRLGVIAGYVTTESPPRLVVNPIVLAALEPDANEAAASAAMDRPGSVAARVAVAEPRSPERPPIESPGAIASTGGNPYSFYGSVAECAFVQRTRCEACVPSATCEPVTNITDGAAECDMLGANNGRGYFLLCINLALAISAVDDCTAEKAPSCPRATDAAHSLGTLEANAPFLDDAACGPGLDACLAEIYGAPPDQFPTLDGGVTPPRPPRDTSVDCGEGCSSSNNNCEASPSCNCDGPSCNNSFSCDSACSSSNDQSGCGGNCDSCNSSGGGGGGGGGGSCGGGGTSSSGGSCGGSSGNSSSCSGGDCGGSGGSCGGGDCGGGDCGGSSGGCGGSGGGCSGGGGNNSCNAAPRDVSGGAALVISLGWAILPIPVAAMVRRRSRRRRDADLDADAGTDTDADADADADAEADAATEEVAS